MRYQLITVFSKKKNEKNVVKFDKFKKNKCIFLFIERFWGIITSKHFFVIFLTLLSHLSAVLHSFWPFFVNVVCCITLILNEHHATSCKCHAWKNSLKVKQHQNIKFWHFEAKKIVFFLLDKMQLPWELPNQIVLKKIPC